MESEWQQRQWLNALMAVPASFEQLQPYCATVSGKPQPRTCSYCDDVIDEWVIGDEQVDTRLTDCCHDCATLFNEAAVKTVKRHRATGKWRRLAL